MKNKIEELSAKVPKEVKIGFSIGMSAYILIILSGLLLKPEKPVFFQASVTILGIIIAASISLYVLRTQVDAQQKREREKEIISDLRASVKCVESIYGVTIQLYANVMKMKEFLDQFSGESEPHIEHKNFQFLYKEITARFRELKAQLDKINTDSLPPGFIFAELISLRVNSDGFISIADRTTFSYQNMELNKSDARELASHAQEVQDMFERVTKQLINKAKPMQKELREKYGNTEIAESFALLLSEENLFPDFKALSKKKQHINAEL